MSRFPEPSTRVFRTGLLDSPFEELDKARCVALFSDYGRGFKTKIMDAYHAKAYVLLTPGLYSRLPEEVLPFCMPVRHDSVEDFANALTRCLAPFPEVDINDKLRARAFRELDQVLGIDEQAIEAEVSTNGDESARKTTNRLQQIAPHRTLARSPETEPYA